jgi:hypothetical protein
MAEKPFHEATRETMGSGSTHYSEAQALRKAEDLYNELKASMGKKKESAQAVIDAAVFLSVMDVAQPIIDKKKGETEAQKYLEYYKQLLKQQGVNVKENACANASGSRGCVVSGGRRRSTRRRNLRKRSTRRN